MVEFVKIYFSWSLEACTASLICFVFVLAEAEVLSKVGESFARGEGRTVIAGTSLQSSKCISANCKMYLYKWPNVFVQIARCICTNGKMYLSKLQDVFEPMAKCICLNCKSMRELDKCQGPKKGHTIVPRWSGDEGVGRVTKYWHWPGGGLRGSPPGILSLMIIFRGKHLLKRYNIMIIFRGRCKKEKNMVLSGNAQVSKVLTEVQGSF